jgi:hypothetical protein
VIRFGVVLSVVLIAIGLLVTGVVAGSLLLVVISIGVALLAFLVLIGVVISFRHEIFGRAPVDVTSAQPSLTAPASRGAMARSAAQAEPTMAASRQTQETAAKPGVEQAARPGATQAARPGAQQAAGPPRAMPVEHGQRTATTGPKAQPAPLSQAQTKVERAAPAPSGSRVSEDESAERERASAQRARPEPAAAGPADDGRGTANVDANRNRLAVQHGAGRLDRPSQEQSAEQAQAEPRRPSRLERESARAAGSRPAAPDTATPGGRPADAPEKPEVSRAAAARAAVQGPAARPVPAATPGEAGARTGELEADATVGDSAVKPARAQPGLVVTEPAGTDLASAGLASAGLASADLAGNEHAGTDQAGTVQAGTDQAGTVQAGTDQAGTVQADTAQARSGPARAGLQGGPGRTGDQEPEASDAARQAGAGEQVGSQVAAASRPVREGDDGAANESPATGDDEMQVSVVPGITRYHKSDCQLIRFLSADDLEVMTRRAATEAGCVPCKACKPDQVAAGATSG